MCTTMDLFENKILRDHALNLKAICDQNGHEIDPSVSAPIFYKLGLFYYKQSPDKISLVKSVGLLNSAVVRKPHNVFEIEKRLSKICREILRLANARDQKANLIKHAQYVKSQIELMRKETSETFKKTKVSLNTFPDSEQNEKIKSLKLIQKQISLSYKKIMRELGEYCINVIGSPPCKFAVVGMGSLARNEITPYSDFEHIILLENQANCKSHLEYFRWFSVIFHVVILNLQETIIPSLSIKYLNDKTCDLGDWFFDSHTSGVSFDGMMPHACKFPLGRTVHTKNKPWTTELIKPVDKMLEYLNSDVNLKNGYRLSDVLMETCFVQGDQSIHDEFNKGIQSCKKSKTTEEIINEIGNQVKNDCDKFAIRMSIANLKPNKKLNIKQMFYRTSTIFIAALGKICHTKSPSCFDIIDELAAQKRLSQKTSVKLLYAVAISCEIRLGIYMHEKSQRNYINPVKNAKTIFDSILHVVDVNSIVSYFQITYCLQREVIRLLKIKETHIYSNPTLLNIAICYALKQDKLMILLLKMLDEGSEYLKCFFKVQSRQLDNNPNFFNETSDYFGENSEISSKSSNRKAEINVKFITFDKCLMGLEQEIKYASKRRLSSALDSQLDSMALLKHLGSIANKLQRDSYEDSLEFWKRYLEILQSLSKNENERQKLKEKDHKFDLHMSIDIVHAIFADCLAEMNQFEEAEVHLNQFLELVSEQDSEENIIANTDIENAEAIKTNKAKDDENKFGKLLALHSVAGNIWFKMKQYQKSLSSLQILLGLFMSVGKSNTKSYEMIQYSGIGTCLLKLNQYEEALIYLKLAVKIIEELKIYSDNSIGNDDVVFLKNVFKVSSTFQSLGKCLMKLQQFKTALPHLRKALEVMFPRTFGEEDEKCLTDSMKSVLEKKSLVNKADILYDIGLCCMKQNRFKEAVTYLERPFKIYTLLHEVNKVASTRFKVFTCYMEIYHHERITNCLKNLHKHKYNIAVNVAKTDFEYLTFFVQLRFILK